MGFVHSGAWGNVGKREGELADVKVGSARPLARSRLTFGGAAFAACLLALGGCSDDGKGSFQIGGDLVISVRPNPVTFGAIATGVHDEKVVTIRHDGTSGTLNLRKVTFESASSELAIGQPSKTALEPGEETSFVVTYDPIDAVLDQGKIFIETNVPSPTTGNVTVEVPVQTVAQSGFLRAIPDPVEFGDVEVGQVVRKPVTLANIGSDDVTLTGVTVRNGIDGEPFSVSFLPTLPATFAPEETITFEVAYAPLRQGGDAGKAEIAFQVQGVTKEIPAVNLLGNGVGPRLVAFPNPVDFGWRALETAHTLPLTIANQGSKDLVITDLALAPGSSPTVSWDGFPSGGATIQPNKVLALTVVFEPTADMVQTSGPIATLVFTSNDLSNEGKAEVFVYGRSEVPLLQVNPPESVDFGFVAQNLANRRTVSLFNAGAAPLQVRSISLPDSAGNEFEIEADGWGPTANPPTAASLLPNEYREVRVKFTNRGGTSGSAFGKLRVESNDAARPQWDVDLKAQRAGAPTCDFRIVPGQLDFGTVARGNRRVMTANLVNVGSGDCSFHSALVNDCASFFGFFDGSCTDPITTPQLNGTSNYYKVTRTPPAIQGGLKAGQSYPLEVTFTPPDSAPIFGDDLTDYAGLLAVRVIDPYSGSVTPVIFPRPLGGASPYPPNLHARSGIAQLAVLPAEVDFGMTTVGCASQTIEVTAYNVGSAPLDLTDLKLQGCSPEFRIRSSPGLPKTLAVNGNEKVTVVYIPQDTSSDACGLAFYTNNEATPTIVVPLKGQGTYETEHTDVFTQTTGQDVDVLFVVDDSGSMDEEQSNLASNFQSFIAGAQTWNNDYHIAVTTTDLETVNGRFVAANGNKRFVTRPTASQFAANVKVGTNGSGDEKGLAAAQAALSLPNTADSGTTCGADTDCTAPERCWDGFCGGRNRGFLRPDAALEVVIVSDEEDHSPGDLAFYVNFFKSIKGIYNTNLFHLHAIVGPRGGCSSSAGSADAGERYINVASQTGGAIVSICDSSFAAGLSSIGDIAFGLRTQFFLGRIPEPSTITVKVGTSACDSRSGANWTYDVNSNSVVFAETGACMPQAGNRVEIKYKTICYLP